MSPRIGCGTATVLSGAALAPSASDSPGASATTTAASPKHAVKTPPAASQRPDAFELDLLEITVGGPPLPRTDHAFSWPANNREAQRWRPSPSGVSFGGLAG